MSLSYQILLEVLYIKCKKYEKKIWFYENNYYIFSKIIFLSIYAAFSIFSKLALFVNTTITVSG